MARGELTPSEIEIRKIISININNLLKIHNKKQIDIHNVTGIPKSTLTGYIKGTSTPNMGNIQKISDFFGVKKSEIDPRFSSFITNQEQTNFKQTTTKKKVLLPDIYLGKYANDPDVFIVLINGESMNKIIPNNSVIAVKKLNSVHDLKNDDIALFTYDNETSVKRFYNDIENKRFLFAPDSSDRQFTDIVVPYSEFDKLEIVGKVVVYVVELD